MAAAAEPHDVRYSAFLSYNRGDVAAARRILGKLESYRLPKRLQAQNDAWDRARRRLKPLFRDLDEMTAAPDINTAVREAMATSQFLVVLCTPRSAQSEWVGREIGMFRALHGDARILAALVEGVPETAFHPALLRNGSAGELLQPLAADFREEGDGPRLALLKLVAVMAGVGLGELVQRDAQRRMRQMGMWALGTVAVLLVVLAAVVVTMQARVAAERERARGGALSGYMLDELRGRLKSAGRLDLLTAANRGVVEYYRGKDLSSLSDAELEQRAKLLLAMGDDEEQRGNLAKAREQIDEALRTTATLLKARPNDPQRMFSHAQSQYFSGMISWRLGDRPRSQAAFEAYRDLAQKMLRADSANPDWWLEAGYAESNLGQLDLRTRIDTNAAEGHFLAALAAFQEAGKRRQGDRTIISSIADTQAWLGDTQRLRGNFAAARESRATQRRLLGLLAAGDPLDRVAKTDLVSNDLAVARIAIAEGKTREALGALDPGQAAAELLAREDPENTRRAAQVRVFDLFRLRAWLAMPPDRRPPAAVLAAANGDCEADRRQLKNDELAMFCSILRAHRTGQAMPTVRRSSDGNRLSPYWGLDFTEEVGRIPHQ